MKFHSSEWYEAVKVVAPKDRMWKEMGRGLMAKWESLLFDCPGGVDKLVEWDVRNTQIVSIKVQEKPAPSDFRTTPVDRSKYLARFVAPYTVFVRLHKQEFTAMVAIGMGLYDILGDLTEVMKKIEAFDALIDLTSTVPAEYE